MSIVGIDFGNMSLLIAQTSKGGVDVILNDASNRQTATCMSFQGKQRFFGDAAAAMSRSNIKNTISCMKLLVGRRYDEPAVQRELSRSFFRHCACPDGGVGVIVTYDDQEKVIPVEHVMAMMLSLAKVIAFNANGKVAIADAVLAVPAWFADNQRRGVLDACAIVGLNCLKVVNETTAIALSYGIYKSAKGLFSETDPVHVMFIDVGYTCYSVTIVDFVQEKLVVRSTAWDHNVAGRDLDDVIIEYLAEEFEKKTKINVRGSPKAMLKLVAAAEKAKKTLSPAGVTEARVSVECLAEDMDLNCTLTLEEFESRAAGIIARLEAPIQSALAEAGLSKEQLTDVEIVGGSSRVQCIKRTIGSILGLDASALNYGLKTTMNSDEAVARGSALQCAILSSRVKVKPFNVTDTVQYPIEVSFESAGAGVAVGIDGEEESKGESKECDGMESVQIFARGDELPHKPRRLTFRNKNSSFDIFVRYGVSAVGDGGSSTNVLPEGSHRTIANYHIEIPEPYASASQGYDVRVTFGLDRSGCVHIVSAHLMEEIIEETGATSEAPAPAPEEGKEGDAAAAPPAVPKRRFKKVDLVTSSLQTFSLSAPALKSCIDDETTMTAADTLIRETADKRNELESFIYSMRDKLETSLKSYCTESEKSNLIKAMDAAEEWLYGDGFESTKAEYAKHLDTLKGPASLIEFRCSEENGRPAACEQLKTHVNHLRTFAANNDADHDHITNEERDTLRREADRVEAWMYDMLGKQADRAQYEDPVLTVESIGTRRHELHGLTNPILTKKRPKVEPPTPVPEAKTEEKGEENKEEAEQQDNNVPESVSSEEKSSVEANENGSEKMDTSN